eukprot:1146135-Pelagomonas_calceolata.AAC.22
MLTALLISSSAPLLLCFTPPHHTPPHHTLLSTPLYALQYTTHRFAALYYVALHRAATPGRSGPVDDHVQARSGGSAQHQRPSQPGHQPKLHAARDCAAGHHRHRPGAGCRQKVTTVTASVVDKSTATGSKLAGIHLQLTKVSSSCPKLSPLWSAWLIRLRVEREQVPGSLGCQAEAWPASIFELGRCLACEYKSHRCVVCLKAAIGGCKVLRAPTMHRAPSVQEHTD